jgi:hypothetical protein
LVGWLTDPPRQGAPFQWSLYLKNQEYQAAAGYLAGLVLLVYKALT